MRLITILTAIALATAASAQDRAGRDTPGEWIIDHHKPFGLWDSMCDHRITGDQREERCYLRYVDVFSPQPKFAAQFLFITPAPEVSFGMERGTRFEDSGFRVQDGSETLWSTARPECLRGRECVFQGKAATELLQSMSDGDAFAFDFIDRHGTDQSLRWDLSPFAAALNDFRTEAAKRGL